MQGKNEDLLQYCLMDAKLVFRLCHLSEIKVKNAQDQIATCSIDFETGKWTILEQPTPRMKSKYHKATDPRPYPMVFGVLSKDKVCMDQILQYQSLLLNPDNFGWISIDINSKA